MKIKLMRFVLCLLVLTVIPPIVLYTATLGEYFTYASNKELAEDASSFTIDDLRPLHLLPQESSSKSKELHGLVYLDNSTESNSDVQHSSTMISARVNRQLTGEELAKKGISSASYLSRSDGHKQSLHDNVIRQVTNETSRIQTRIQERSSKQNDLSRDPNVIRRNGFNEEGILLDSGGSSKIAAEKMKQSCHHSAQLSGTNPRENVKVVAEKLNDHVVIPDARVLQFKGQLIRARVYLSLAATRTNSHFIRELRLRIKEVQKVLGEATKDSDLPRSAADKLKAMEQTLLKGKQIVDDCGPVVKKLRAMLHSVEEQLRVQRKQALFLTHLTAKTIPKGLHCLPLRLSRDYFNLNVSQQQFPNMEKLEDSKLYHYALFSDNVLAAAVVVNSTIIHARDPSNQVFHIVTDRLNYAAMRMWFLANPPGKATIQVQNVDEFTWLNSSYSPVLKQLGSASMIDYYFRNRRADSDPNMKYRNPKYLSIMNHLRFYLPEIFSKLDKILFLDDDIVVQKDLSSLWSLDLKGKVIGVVETCGESFHRFDRYLNFSNPLISKTFNPRACGWAFGLNIFDLNTWRKQNITHVYHKWQNLNHDRQLWKLGTLPPGLITFWNQTYPLDKSWHVLGLGYNPNVPQKDIERAAVIHYNGNLKPWLEISIPKFKNYWSKYVDYDQVYLHECNISP